MNLRRVPRLLAVVSLSPACSGPSTADSGVPDSGPTTDAGSDAGYDAGVDAGSDGGCTLPSDFPPDAAQYERFSACFCQTEGGAHPFVEGGPRCTYFGSSTVTWTCCLMKAADGGYVPRSDGRVECFC
jgi:hypothetical protein